MTNSLADFADPPTNSQESSIAQPTADLVPRSIRGKIPPMDKYWSVSTMQAKSSRAGVEELLRQFGENPEDPRLKKLKARELYGYAGEMQQRYMDSKARDPSVSRPVPVVDTDYVSDDETAASSFFKNQQPTAAAFSAKRARESVEEDEDDGPVVPRRARRANLKLSAKAKGKQPIKVATHIEVEGEVQESKPLELVEVKAALEAIKRVTFQDMAREALRNGSYGDVEMSGYREGEYKLMSIIFVSQDPLLSLAAQTLVRPIMRHRSKEIVEVYQEWCELGRAIEESRYLSYHFNEFEANMKELKDEVIEIIRGEGLGGNAVVGKMLNDMFAGDIKHGRI
jgi:hypothetical protein